MTDLYTLYLPYKPRLHRTRPKGELNLPSLPLTKERVRHVTCLRGLTHTNCVKRRSPTCVCVELIWWSRCWVRRRSERSRRHLYAPTQQCVWPRPVTPTPTKPEPPRHNWNCRGCPLGLWANGWQAASKVSKSGRPRGDCPGHAVDFKLRGTARSRQGHGPSTRWSEASLSPPAYDGPLHQTP